MKEVSVESVDHLRIELERDSHEKFEMCWNWFEIVVMALNFALYVTTLYYHYAYFQMWTNFMVVYTLFLLSPLLKFLLTELLWVLLRLLLQIFCCPEDPASQKAIDSYNNIKYISKKAMYLFFISYGFYNLKGYFRATSKMISVDASIMIFSGCQQIQEDLWKNMFSPKEEKQIKEHLEVIGNKYYRIKNEKLNKFKNEADQMKKGFNNVPEANSEILEKCLIDEGFSVISNSTVERETGSNRGSLQDEENQSQLGNNVDFDEIQTQKRLN